MDNKTERETKKKMQKQQKTKLKSVMRIEHRTSIINILSVLVF